VVTNIGDDTADSEYQNQINAQKEKDEDARIQAQLYFQFRKPFGSETEGFESESCSILYAYMMTMVGVMWFSNLI
jgi:hypothetical protein